MLRSFLMPAVLLAGACAAALPVRAERLGKDVCEALKAEEASLVTAGVKTDMERGPEWAKTNLAPERMQQIARLIDVTEQLNFRCREIKAPPPQKAVAAPVAADTKQDASATGASKPALKPVQKKPQTTAGAPPTGLQPAPTVIKPKPVAKPAPKPKVQPPPAQVRTKPPAPQKPGLFSIE